MKSKTQGGKNPRLKTYNSMDNAIFPISTMNPQDMVTKVQNLESAMLSKKNDDGITCPMQTVTKDCPAMVRLNSQRITDKQKKSK